MADHIAEGTSARGRVTSHDVARVAQVSQSTVSLVMAGNWTGRVGQDTAQRVLQVSRALGYQPNLAARGLRLGRTGTVMLVVPVLTNPFFAAVHAGAAHLGEEHGIGVVVFPLDADDGRGPFQHPRQAIDGIIACSLSAESIAPLAEGLALVTLDDAPSRDVPSVCVDVTGGMRQAVEHVLSLGHRRLVHLRAPRASWTFARRSDAFQALVREHGQIVAGQVTCSFDVSHARDTAARLLSESPRPTALLCDDDNIAAGVYAASHQLGLSIPDDVSVIGFDDLPLASWLRPQLTTLKIPAEELGARGMEMFLHLQAGVVDEPSLLQPSLVIRGSTGAAAGTDAADLAERAGSG